MNLSQVNLSLVVLLCCSVSTAIADPHKDKSGHGWKGDRYEYPREWRDERRGSYFHDRGYARLRIPPGHYPPPGECRVWYPGRPPGHQPPPGRCGRVPPGAWLIRHRHDRPDHVDVTVYESEYRTVYEPRHSPRVLAIGEFEIGSGAFVRLVLEDS